MAPRKADIATRLPIRRGLGEAEAAIYIGIGSTKFRELVLDGRMPQPRRIDSARCWDVDELDAAFKSLPRDGDDLGSESLNPWHK